MIKGLNHITLAVSNLEESFLFYRDILEVTVKFKSQTTAYFHEGNLWLALSLDPNQSTSEDYSHLTFEVGKDDFSKLEKKIKDSGAKIFKENSSEGSSLYFEDPCGHKLEIHVGGLYQRLIHYQTHPKEDYRFSNENDLLLKSKRLILSLPALNSAADLLEFHQMNRDHFDPWDPLKPDDFYTLGYWKNRIASAHAEFDRGQSVRFCLYDRQGEGLVGMANFTNFERGPFQNCRLGYKISSQFQGQGLMSEGLRVAIDYIFNERGFHRIEANYIPRNIRSGNLLKALGFKEHGIAKDYLKIAGRWQDHVLTSKTSS